MTATLVICGSTCLAMIIAILLKPKIKLLKAEINTYWIIVLGGAMILIFAGLIQFDEIKKGLTNSTGINPLQILILFISMTILSIFLDEIGFFRYLANIVAKKFATNQLKLFTSFYITISLLTIFTSNDIIILTLTPFICYFAKNAKINPIPYLIMEFVAANTCSMLLIIGNPTNIYLATASGITFVDYLKVMILPTFFASVVAYIIMLLLFKKTLKNPLTRGTEDYKIENKFFLITGLIHLGTCTILLVISSYINIEMWIITLCAMASLTITVLIYACIKKKKPIELAHSFRRAPWDLIPFILSMFVLVLALEKQGVTEKIASMLSKGNIIFELGTTSVVFANLINNIPMSVLFSKILQSLDTSYIIKGTYAAIIGSNIGAFLTPIGALAGIMWLSILKSHKINFNFISFMKYGFIIAVPTLLAALLGLFIVFI